MPLSSTKSEEMKCKISKGSHHLGATYLDDITTLKEMTIVKAFFDASYINMTKLSMYFSCERSVYHWIH